MVIISDSCKKESVTLTELMMLLLFVRISFTASILNWNYYEIYIFHVTDYKTLCYFLFKVSLSLYSMSNSQLLGLANSKYIIPESFSGPSKSFYVSCIGLLRIYFRTK